VKRKGGGGGGGRIVPHCVSHHHISAFPSLSLSSSPQIGRAKGEVSDEERVKLEARIGELQKELEEARATEKSLQAEAKKVKNSLNAAVRHAEDVTKQLDEVGGRIDELLLQARSGEDGLRKAIRDKEEAMVAHDLLKLEVRRLRDALSNKTDEVFTLENRAAQLEMSIEARKKEVEAHRIVQRAAAKLAEEERHKLALDLGERMTRINTLKAKYETLCARIRGGDAGGNGEEKSQAYFVLMAAQRREELQREGDELDRLIKKAERETKALANTLQYLNARNDAFRAAFHQVDEGSDEVSIVRALETQANDAQDALFRRKRQLAAAGSEADEAARRTAALGDRAAGLAAQLAALEAEAARVEAERVAQLRAVEAAGAKLDAARQRHRRARAAARGGQAGGPTPDEIAFVAQGLRDTNASVLYTLGQLAVEYPQMKPALAALVAQRGLRMPARPPSRLPLASTTAGSGLASAGGGGANLSALTGGAGPARLAAPVPVSPMVAPPAAAPRGGTSSSNRGRPSSAGSEGRGSTPTRGGGGGGGGGRGGAQEQKRGGGQGGAAQGAGGLGMGIMGRPLSGQVQEGGRR
jgi:hypothetical protein